MDDNLNYVASEVSRLASGQAAAAWTTGRPVPSLEWLYKELERRYRLKRILYRMSDRSLDRLMGKFNLEVDVPTVDPFEMSARLVGRIVLSMLPSIAMDRLRGGGIMSA